MAEDFQTDVCGGSGNWWNPTRTNSFATSPCTAALNDSLIGGFGWSTPEMVDINARSSDESTSSIISDNSIHVFPDTQKSNPPPPQPSDSSAVSGGAGLLIDQESTLQMMGFNLSSSSASSDWNPTLLHGSGRGEVNFHSILQEDAAGTTTTATRLSNYPPGRSGEEDSTMLNAFKPINLNQCFSLDQQRLLDDNPPVSSTGNALSSYPMSSYGYPTTTLLQNMIDIEPQPQQQASLFYPPTTTMVVGNNYSNTNMNVSSPSWPKFSHPFLKPSLPKMQPSSPFQFSDNPAFWNTSSTAGVTNVRASLFPPSQPQFLGRAFEEKPNLQAKANNDAQQEVKKNNNETVFKRPRIETPSPLPTFKVRKEKLGDRITALQQLVSPFGKTDTASVLHEAIECIKFLHDQVSVLSTPYLKNEAPIQYQQASEKLKETEGAKQDLRSRGLCLVPISSTFPVANEATTDYWTPTFGGTFR